MKFRKKPIVVHAEQYEGRPGGLHSADPHCPIRAVHYGYHPNMGHTGPCPNLGCGELVPYIETAHGNVPIEGGTWIVRDPNSGDAWPVSPDIFAATYEPVSSDHSEQPTASEGEG